jgi:LytR cell envelope-related transcriptional attenuator
MQTERPPTEAPPPSSPRSSPARGVVLVAAAVVLGLFLLRALEDSAPTDGIVGTDTTEAAGDSGDGGGTDTTAAGESDGTTTTPPVEARPPAEVVVRVANASGVAGAAGARTEQLAGAGYQTVDATNGPEGQVLPATQIWFAEGYNAEAGALAEALGVPADGVVALPA